MIPHNPVNAMQPDFFGFGAAICQNSRVVQPEAKENVMEGPHAINRRAALAGMAAAGGVALLGSPAQAQAPAAPLKGRIKQCVSRWCYSKIPMDEFCTACKEMGIVGIDLLDPPEYDIVKQHGLVSSMCNGPGPIHKGWNDTKNHDDLVKKGEARLQEVAQAGWPNMIVLAGNRHGISDEDGLKNAAKGLKRIMPLAEKLGVNVVMELLNSKRDHKDYSCDRTAWGVELVKRVGSDRFKLLYDIYHMQIMEGDIIATISENFDYIGHIHTGGVPGRHEIDETQELNYRRICEVLAEKGFKGFVAHEFMPTRDPLASLKQAVSICDV
jgi:hydroxypyruvate isomerase